MNAIFYFFWLELMLERGFWWKKNKLKKKKTAWISVCHFVLCSPDKVGNVHFLVTKAFKDGNRNYKLFRIFLTLNTNLIDLLMHKTIKYKYEKNIPSCAQYHHLRIDSFCNPVLYYFWVVWDVLAIAGEITSDLRARIWEDKQFKLCKYSLILCDLDDFCNLCFFLAFLCRFCFILK